MRFSEKEETLMFLTRPSFMCGGGNRQIRGAADRTRRLRAHRRPALETLECRALLSTWTVNNPDDTGGGSLRWAIDQANIDTDTAGSLIRFDPIVFSNPQTITLSHQLELSNTAVPVVIDASTVSSVTVSGNRAVRVLLIDSGVTATIKGLTITDGNAA